MPRKPRDPKEPKKEMNDAQRANQFKPGNAGRFYGGKTEQEYEEGTLEVPIENDGAPQDLLDMRHVRSNPRQFDRTWSQREYRKIFVADRSAFVRLLAGMEKDWRQEKRLLKNDGDAEAKEAEDIGTDKAIAMCEEFLRQAAEKSKAGMIL